MHTPNASVSETVRQIAIGRGNVQIRDVAAGAEISVRIGGGPERKLPLVRAFVPVPAHINEPSRLLRARAALVSWIGRLAARADLLAWAISEDAYRLRVIGGRGGSGKTRLGVEICRQLTESPESVWVTGLLAHEFDREQLEALADTPTPRLIVIDYAETRTGQVELLLPQLAASAAVDRPVRVLLLVRSAPIDSTDWVNPLRKGGDDLDRALDEADQLVLQDEPFTAEERQALYDATIAALVVRGAADVHATTPDAPRDAAAASVDLSTDAFGTPLLVVVAGFLAAQGADRIPDTRTALLEELARHEARIWEHGTPHPPVDVELLRRSVALATLAGADGEPEAVQLLTAIPDLAEPAAAQSRGAIARWIHHRYPGPRWWNAVEPDLLGEHLVVKAFAEDSDILGKVLDRENVASLTQPLDLYARAAPGQDQLRRTLRQTLSAVLADRLPRLCASAAEQAAAAGSLDDLLSATPLAPQLARILELIDVPIDRLVTASTQLPNRTDLIITSLSLALCAQLTAKWRGLVQHDWDRYARSLGIALNDQAISLATVGRHEEALRSIDEAVEIRTRLAEADPAVHAASVAFSLANRATVLAGLGRRQEALDAIENAMQVFRPLVESNWPAYGPEFADLLTTQSNRLSELGRSEEALVPIEKAVQILRLLAEADPEAHAASLALSLNCYCHRLGELDRLDAASGASEEAVQICRRLAEENPAAYAPELARSLNNRSIILGMIGRREESLKTMEETVRIRRRLAEANPGAFERDLAGSLTNLATRLAELDRREEALRTITEALQIRRRLADENPVAHAPKLAELLNYQSIQLAELGKREEALGPIEEAVQLYHELAQANPSVYADALGNALRLHAFLTHTTR